VRAAADRMGSEPEAATTTAVVVVVAGEFPAGFTGTLRPIPRLPAFQNNVIACHIEELSHGVV
jgi:hypothetical protein